MNQKIVPKIKRSIEDFLYEEEGNITRNKILSVGSMVIIMGVLLATDAFAGHSSHRSHSSHKSHSSHSSHKSHSSHSSGSYHSSHGSHSSHSNTHSSHGSHSNVTTTAPAVELPSMKNISLKTVPETVALGLADNIETSFILPDTPKIK